MKQAEIIKKMSDDELRRQLLLSQSILFFISIILSFFFFSHFTDWFQYFIFDFKQIFLYGVLTGLGVVIFELILYIFVPKRHFDDGGINEKIFKNQSVFHILIISIVVAISEEFLFRGVVQTTFGYIFASSLFVIVHFRYLKKPFLLIITIIVSFFIGYLFELTQNLLVTIAFHFIVELLLGLLIRFKK